MHDRRNGTVHFVKSERKIALSLAIIGNKYHQP